jgi:urate oxidase
VCVLQDAGGVVGHVDAEQAAHAVVPGRGEVGDLEAAWARVRDRLLEAFTDHHSPSVQFTLRRMGEAVLEAHPEIDRIHLSLPNRHHLPFDVSRFGLEDRGEVFHATTEPFGLIEATVERD